MRKSKKTISRLKNIFRSLQSGSSIVDACRAVGIDYTTLYSWEQKDQRLKEKIEGIIDSRVLVVEDKLYSRLVKGEASPAEYIFYLCNRAQDRWKRNALVNNTIINQNKLGSDGGFSDEDKQLTEQIRQELFPELPKE